MQVVITPHPSVASVVVLAVTGSVDSLNADTLSQQLAAPLQQGRAQLVADFARVDYTSSAGLRALLGSVKSCRAAGGDLRLAALQPQVARVIEIAGFRNVLHIYPDVEQAVQSYGERT